MGVIFGQKNIYSAKDFKWNKAEKSGMMKDILKDKGVAIALDKSSKREEFYSALKSRAEGGVSVREMQEVVGHFMKGEGKKISRKEARVLAESIMKGQSKKYTYKNTDISMDSGTAKKDTSSRNSAPIVKNYGPAPLKAIMPDANIRRGPRMETLQSNMKKLSPSFTKPGTF